MYFLRTLMQQAQFTLAQQILAAINWLLAALLVRLFFVMVALQVLFACA
jgi:hypothetical protein